MTQKHAQVWIVFGRNSKHHPETVAIATLTGEVIASLPDAMSDDAERIVAAHNDALYTQAAGGRSLWERLRAWFLRPDVNNRAAVDAMDRIVADSVGGRDAD